MPKNAVVDASVLICAFLFPESVPGRVPSGTGGLCPCTSLPILLEETRRSLRNPRLRDLYGHTDDAVEAWCARLHDIGCLLTTPLPDIAPARRDPNDDHVIAAALAAGAEYIVTGDRDLLALGRYETIRIITARRFLDDITAD